MNRDPADHGPFCSFSNDRIDSSTTFTSDREQEKRMREIIYHDELQELKVHAVELPEITGPLEDSEASYSFNAARRQVVPMDLEKYGYVEEEFIVSGYANVYEYHDVGLYPKIRCENGRYTTRILVRRPKDPLKQSDFAVLEIFNYAGPERAFAGWGFCGEYMLSRGDVWVGITIKQNAVNGLKQFDPKRYGDLGFPNPVPKEKRRPVYSMIGRTPGEDAQNYESGLAYDAMGQVAALLKSRDSRNPLFRNGVSRKPAKYVIGMGASGCDLSLYAAALQPFLTTDGTHPCFDGFHIHMTGYPGSISNGETRFEACDDRCKIMTNVPLVWTQTMGDMRGGGVHPSYSYMYRWPDSDLPGRQHRQYEIAAAPLGLLCDRACTPCDEDVERYTGKPTGKKETLEEDGEILFFYVLRAVLDALKKWIRDGVPAPKSQYLEMKGEYPDADFVLDEHGNPKGGVRSPYVDVPVKTYTWIDDFSIFNQITPFSDEKLKSLYGSREEYLKKVIISTMKMVADGYLLAEDAPSILFDLMKVRIPE